MMTCPYCGTNYLEFQANCNNCGGSLPLPAELPRQDVEAKIAVPPPAPRDLPDHYIWRVLASDGWAVAGGVFILVGGIFTVVGIVLTAVIITIFVGIPFAFTGLAMLGTGLGLATWRYKETRLVEEILMNGEPVLGKITEVNQNYYIRVNGRHPWTIQYQFTLDGGVYVGKTATLGLPDVGHRPGTDVYILYQPGDPQRNCIYPHPYSYY